MNKLKGKKIKLLPVQIHNKETQKHCPQCDGIGWTEKDKHHIERCLVCGGSGIVNVCSECGKETSSAYTSLCKNCREKQWKENRIKKEQLKFENSKKLTFGIDDEKIQEFDYFYSEYYPYNDGFFTDLEELMDELSQEELPQYVWGTSKAIIDIDINNAIDEACEDLWEGARDTISDADFNELEQFVLEWCKKQLGTTSYYPDYNYAIIIPKDVII